MINSVLPSGVIGAETFSDLDEALHPEEEAAIARARPRRQREFRTVRACARTALAGLGINRPSLAPGADGLPPWPEPVLGSMTHCDGYAAAAAGPTDCVAALGIDAEPDAPLPPGVLRLVASAAEQEHLDALAVTYPGRSWERLLFCAKEAMYKAWYPRERRWLGFEDVRVRIESDGTFAVEFLDPEAGGFFREVPVEGRWTAAHGLLLASVAAPGPVR
ncbi:4'-phosphopantetheinyl transferase superfamily protein [Sinomonas sp. JGH33]|uniref:4'-phosphopantetheinyl transferase superfamily protein n=1 Tax=Sinomonas terricola TaxID=3110330 RepID=A0ABU5T6I0_9MICC|nr:4'-phosphopantetheinyl transferase superfamily protein [Sinomonas sp. JGH33]MEA5455183.1 4'-phosphopantetheinyl transferase superfamily protein [Sinomonas sp. JGH33]